MYLKIYSQIACDIALNKKKTPPPPLLLSTKTNMEPPTCLFPRRFNVIEVNKYLIEQYTEWRTTYRGSPITIQFEFEFGTSDKVVRDFIEKCVPKAERYSENHVFNTSAARHPPLPLIDGSESESEDEQNASEDGQDVSEPFLDIILEDAIHFHDGNLLARIKHVRLLDVRGASISNFAFLQNMPSLETLFIDKCVGICNHLDSLASCTSLKCLHMDDISQLRDWDFLTKLVNLERLTMTNALMSDSYVLSKCKKLKYLNLSSSIVPNLEGLKSMTELEELILDFCDCINDFSGIARLPLKSLSLNHCDQIICSEYKDDECDLPGTNLWFIEKIPLVKLSIQGCYNLTGIDVCRHIPTLQYLDISECEDMSDFGVFKKLPALRILHMRDLLAENLNMLEIMPLQYLDISGCSKLRKIDFVASLPRLKTLHMSQCHKIKSIVPLTKNKTLESVVIMDCPNVENFGIAEALKKINFDTDHPELRKQLEGVSTKYSLPYIQ